MSSTAKPDFYRIGQSDACSLVAGTDPETFCVGFFGKEFAEGDSELAERLLELKGPHMWTGSGSFIDRVPSVSGQMSRIRIRALSRGRAVALGEVGAAGVVVARLEVAPNSMPDQRYGISDDNSMERYYYLIVRKYTDDQNDVKEDGRRIADWQVFGIRKASGGNRPTLVLMKEGAGKFRYCKMTHRDDITRGGASFLKCTSTRLYMAAATLLPDVSVDSLVDRLVVEANGRLTAYDSLQAEAKVRSLLSATESFNALTEEKKTELARIIARIFTELPTDPAWQHCGAGCCTADDQ